MDKGHKPTDIRAHRFIPKISTTTKVMVDKKRKQKSRRFLNDKKNWAT